VALTEMGPSLDCVVRRTRLPPVDLEKEALRQPEAHQEEGEAVESAAELGSNE